MESEEYISIISNIVLEPYFVPFIKKKFMPEKKIKVFCIPYEECFSGNNRTKIELSQFVIVWINLEIILSDVSKSVTEQEDYNIVFTLCRNIYVNLLEHVSAKIIWISFENYFMHVSSIIGSYYDVYRDRLNCELNDIFDNDVTFIDLGRLVAEIGISNAYDRRGKYRWNSPYTKALINEVVNEIYKQYLIEYGISKKCIVVDCDNVLWGGVLSDDGIENIKIGKRGLGKPYYDFQLFLLFLHYHGVILTVCSKNNEEEVMCVFKEHSEMVLREEHIVCFQVNWDNKIDSIKNISDVLNLDLNSMVFIDDSLNEVEAVKRMLPEVTTILYKYETIYDQLDCFNLKRNVDQVIINKRNKTYKTNALRENLKGYYNKSDEYIKALEQIIDIHEAIPIEFSRIAELTQRTNRFTNGKRYSVKEIKKRFVHDDVKLYSLFVSDCFSELGLVGAFEIENNTLTLFCLSCRALGRKVEEKMIEFIINNFQVNYIEFTSTEKNDIVKNILSQSFPKVFI